MFVTLTRGLLPKHGVHAPTVAEAWCRTCAGGLGSLGSLVAQWAAAHPKLHVWLVGRSGRTRAPRGAAWALPATASAQLHIMQCDTSSASDSAALAAAVVSAGAGPIRGIVHASGLLKDAMLATQTSKTLRSVFAPKVQVLTPGSKTLNALFGSLQRILVCAASELSVDERPLALEFQELCKVR